LLLLLLLMMIVAFWGKMTIGWWLISGMICSRTSNTCSVVVETSSRFRRWWLPGFL
jgi:hypothetical protein